MRGQNIVYPNLLGLLDQRVMDDVILQLMDEVARSYQENLHLPDELLLALHFVFQAPLQSALDLVERKNVTLLRSPSGRTIFQVIGSVGHSYSCRSQVNYCECLAYRYSVLMKSEYIMCKHVLAVLLSEAMSTYGEQHVSDEEMANLLKAVD